MVEMGIGMRLTLDYGNRLVDGIFNMMHKMGMWSAKSTAKIAKPTLSTKGEVCFMNAEASGIIIPTVSHSVNLKKRRFALPHCGRFRRKSAAGSYIARGWIAVYSAYLSRGVRRFAYCTRICIS